MYVLKTKLQSLKGNGGEVPCINFVLRWRRSVSCTPHLNRKALWAADRSECCATAGNRSLVIYTQ
jgi:hypothetical protein